ncbi:MAG: hypothetical protein DKT66_20120 [Candidatus Melainabacteria bacterium]|nr:MAG: hypothetical protein DKT66_20120 [Candidatus Melainabacteria bacterium]
MAESKGLRFYMRDDLVAQLSAMQKRVLYQDDAIPALRLIVNPSGRRCWFFYKSINGKPTKLKLGEFPHLTTQEAREIILLMLKEVQLGEPPKSIRPKALMKRIPRYREVFNLYVRDYLKVHKRDKEWIEAEQSFNRCHQDFAEKRISDITRSELQAWINRLGTERGNQTANREFNRLQAAIHYGEKMGLYKLESDPTKHIQRFPDVRRTRYLSQEETLRLLEVLKTRSDYQRDIVMLALFTAARKGNILAAQWNEIDLDNRIWRIPAHKSKSGNELVLALTESAVSLLVRRKIAVSSSPWVFPSLPDICGRKSASGHIENFNKAWREICAEAGLDDVHFHDLRHSVASWLGAQGVNAFTIMDVLGHSTIATTVRYTHLNQDVSRAALEAAHQKLMVEPLGALELVKDDEASRVILFDKFVKRRTSRTQSELGDLES